MNAMDLENALECSNWLQAMYVDVSPHFVLPRLREVDLMLSALDDAARAAFRVTQRMLLADGNSGYRLSKELLARADRLIAKGRTTPYGQELQRRSIDSDAQIVN